MIICRREEGCLLANLLMSFFFYIKLSGGISRELTEGHPLATNSRQEEKMKKFFF
jgi:hypothetical protein